MDKKEEILKIVASLCESTADNLNAIKSLIEIVTKFKNSGNNNSEPVSLDVSDIFVENSEESDEIGKMNSEIRQKAILDKIKQFSSENGDGCGLRELMSFFPYISDRTLRYDLQKLALNNFIIKIGN